MPIVYLNGEYMRLEDAMISPLDRGFTFGDGVYEVIPVYNGRIFRFNEHIDRLENSLRLIYMHEPLAREQWADILQTLVLKNEGENQSIYLQVTRGVSGRDHAFDDNLSPTIFVMSRPLPEPDNSAGVTAILHEDIRWKWCHIKAITLLPSVLLRHAARQKGAREVILHHDGEVTEGAASNVFICNRGRVLTPPKSESLLPGITRDLVIELLNQEYIDCAEINIDLEQLRNAEEIWITSSTQEIVPVIELDGEKVGNGVTGPVWHRINRAYQAFKHSYRKTV